VLRPLLWLVLGTWLGAMALFAADVAPAAFRVLPSPDLAGALVGAVLGGLQLAGAAAGALLAVLALALGRGPLAIALPLALAGLSLANHLGVTPAIDAIRLAGPNALADPILARRFAHLHHLSVLLFGTTMAGLLALAALHAHAEARR
jgi:hypothetical protein